MTTQRIDPPLATDEVTTLRAFLAYHRATGADAAVDRALAKDGLDTPSVKPSRRKGTPISLRWILLHMIEEYARHNGHADLLREAIDGQVGE